MADAKDPYEQPKTPPATPPVIEPDIEAQEAADAISDSEVDGETAGERSNPDMIDHELNERLQDRDHLDGAGEEELDHPPAD